MILGRPFSGMHVTPGATSYLGGCVAGTSVRESVPSTTLRRAETRRACPVRSDVIVPSRAPEARVGHGDVLDAPRRQEALAHHLLEVVEDLRARRELLHPPVQPGPVREAAAEVARANAVGRRLVKAHERVRVVPVASGGRGGGHDHARVGLVEQRPRTPWNGAGADDGKWSFRSGRYPWRLAQGIRTRRPGANGRRPASRPARSRTRSPPLVVNGSISAAHWSTVRTRRTRR